MIKNIAKKLIVNFLTKFYLKINLQNNYYLLDKKFSFSLIVYHQKFVNLNIFFITLKNRYHLNLINFKLTKVLKPQNEVDTFHVLMNLIMK